MAEHQRRQAASSWHRWTAGVTRAGRAPSESDPPEAGADDDMDVTLHWPAGSEPSADDPDAESGDLDDDDLDGEPADASDDDTGVAAPFAYRRGEDGDVDLAELLPAVPLLPSIAGRVDALDGQLRAISMRLDVLGSAVASLRSAIAERVDAYAEAAASATRQADDALEEHRRSTQRSAAELRRGVAQHEDALRRLSARVEELVAEVVSSIEGTGAAPAPAPDLRPVESAIDELAERLEAGLSRLESATSAGDDVPAMRAAVDDLGLRVGEALAVLGERLAAPTPVEPAPAVDVDLAPLQRTLGEIHALVQVIVDTMPASAEGSGADLADRVADAVVRRLDVDDLARQVAERLRQHFEVITENEG